MFLQFILLIPLIYSTSIPLSCDDASNQEDCLPVINSIYECTWAADQCQTTTCEHLQLPNCEGAIYNWQPCSVVDGACISINQCLQVKKQDVCPHIHPKGKQCIWNNRCEEQDCSYFNAENCTNINGMTCLIINDKCTSVTDCSFINYETLCNESTIDGNQCQWVDEKCGAFSCRRYQTVQDCQNSLLQNNIKCFNLGTSTDVYCAGCSDLDQIGCNKSFEGRASCQWDGGKCFQADSCSVFTSTDPCANAFGGLTCTWYGPLNKCVRIMEANQLDRECDVRASEYLVIMSILLLILYI